MPKRGRPLAGLRLTDAQLREIQRLALAVPHHLRAAFLHQIAAALDGKVIGDGAVHRAARHIARSLAWNATSVIS
jgi:hypothetical protein